MTDEVSVVLPYFNREETVIEAVKSVLGQTHKQLRLYLVNDGSTDRSRELVHALKDSRIVHLDAVQNGGASRARNLGLDAACAELVAFMDSDDRWHETKLEKQLRTLRASQEQDPRVAVVGCGWQYMDGPSARREFAPGPFTRTEFLRGALAGTGTPLLVVDRGRAAEAKFDPVFPAFEEGDYLLKCLAGDRLLAIVPEILVDVRRGRSDHVANRESAARAYALLLRTYEEDYAAEPSARSWFSFRACREYLCMRQLGPAMRLLPTALGEERLRRTFHLALSAVFGTWGLAAAQRIVPIVHPSTRRGV